MAIWADCEQEHLPPEVSHRYLWRDLKPTITMRMTGATGYADFAGQTLELRTMNAKKPGILTEPGSLFSSCKKLQTNPNNRHANPLIAPKNARYQKRQILGE